MVVEKKMIDYIRKVSPGNPIRTVIDDLVRSNLGAIIVLETPELYSKNMFEGGFKINTKFSPQKLFELCKMDGAIILSDNFKKIIYANVQITPDNTIYTHETGTRHKSAERCAKQAKTFVIAVSERRRKTTLYLENSRHNLRNSDEIMRDITANLQVLEDQRKIFDALINRLNILEMSSMTSSMDVCKVIQKGELILRINEEIRKQIIEIGSEGKIIAMRFRELTRNTEKIENEIIRDYSAHTLKRTKTILENLSYEDLLDLDTLTEKIIQKETNESIEPRGYRFLSHLEITNKEISMLVKQFKVLTRILNLNQKELEQIFRNKAESVKKSIEELREQILSGREMSD